VHGWGAVLDAVTSAAGPGDDGFRLRLTGAGIDGIEASHGSGAWSGEERLDEGVGVKVEQILGPLAHADEEDGHAQGILDGEGNTPARS
jgi:hypothetical protein